jgi:hypothetical protein
MSNRSPANAPEENTSDENTIDEKMIEEKNPTGPDEREHDEIRARDRR